jgi:uncharacterized protein (TIGR02444 family)
MSRIGGPAAPARSARIVTEGKMKMSDFPASELWDFTLSIYGQQGVSQACIALQDRRGLDVDVMLFCSWLGATGRGAIGREELDRAWDAIAIWQVDVVSALRAVRRRIKDGFPEAPEAAAKAVGKAVLSREIEAERISLIMLEGTTSRPAAPERPAGERAADAAANYALYFTSKGVEPDATDRADLLTILSAAVGDGDADADAALHGAFVT